MVMTGLLPATGQLKGADLPPFDKVSEGYEQVNSSDIQNEKTLFSVWKREKDSQVLVELPKNFAGKRYFVALTVSSGDRFAGLQSGDWVVEWRRYDDRLALIVPNLAIRASGDAEGKASVKRLFTDQVILDMPILAMGPNNGPVIDADNLLVGNATRFFGGSVQVTNPRVTKIAKAKTFPLNVELAFEIVGRGGILQTIHYSFSEVPTGGTYKPRKADERVGYFTTAYSDLGQYDDEKTRVRYINRWHLEKRDPRLKLSPAKEPIVFYIEHTTPVRYRRWVKEGVEFWNKAFEKVGILDAIVVEVQDAVNGKHMEKDPEDVRYNFVRWLNNDIGTAIGPSRVHPETGQILDADIVLTDGWIRHFNFNYNELMPKLAMEGSSSETLAWLAKHPSWDPRVRLARADQQQFLRQQFARQSTSRGFTHEMMQADPSLIGDDPYDGLYGRLSQVNGYCMAASGRQMDMALARMNWEFVLMADKEAKQKKKKDKKKKKDDGAESKDESDDESADESDEEGDEEEEVAEEKSAETKQEEENLLDGIPEWFVGPLLADLVAHEVGHTLGLRHNFKASSLYSLDEINSEEVKEKGPFSSSVMDYIPINYRYEAGEIQGDFGMTEIGPYDYWAIEYGYTSEEGKLAEILKRCNEPALQYATDEDTGGPDPLARRYDFAKDPLDYATEQMKLIEVYRGRLLESFVKDGDSWAKARRGYELTLSLQTRAVNMMAGWVGGAFINRAKKGDPGDRDPVEVVPAEQQRSALTFIIDTTFHDKAYGLTPELLAKMSIDQWSDDSATFGQEATWPIHDRILGVQASTLTMLMNPTTLRRVYDNELRLSADVDTLTLPELLDTVTAAAWSELGEEIPDDSSARKPVISSLRRNLQGEHLGRLIDLVLATDSQTAALKPISTLAAMSLRDLQTKVDAYLESAGDKLDPYSRAHLVDAQQRIERALDAGYTIGGGAAGAGQTIIMMSGETPAAPGNN
ncbi:zinc-dependent metalloprotease [Planctomycetaceae bacterium SH139]